MMPYAFLLTLSQRVWCRKRLKLSRFFDCDPLERSSPGVPNGPRSAQAEARTSLHFQPASKQQLLSVCWGPQWDEWVRLVRCFGCGFRAVFLCAKHLGSKNSKRLGKTTPSAALLRKNNHHWPRIGKTTPTAKPLKTKKGLLEHVRTEVLSVYPRWISSFQKAHQPATEQPPEDVVLMPEAMPEDRGPWAPAR